MFTFENPILIVILLVAITVFTLSTIFLFIGNKSLKSEVNDINDELSDKERKISEMEESIQNLRKLKHDNIKQLLFVEQLIKSGEFKEAENFVSELVHRGDVSFDKRISGDTKDKNTIKKIASCICERCEKEGVDYKFFVDDINSRIPVNISELNSIISNILENSLRAVMENGSERKYIRLNAYEDNILFCIKIRNNGPEIADTEKIFRKGFTSHSDGNGFGLYIVKETVEKYNGCVFAESNRINTVFTILLPKQ